MHLTLATLAALMAAPVWAEATLEGRNVTFQVITYDDPDAPLLLSKLRYSKVGDGIEFDLRPEGGQNGLDVLPVSIDISAGRITWDFSPTPRSFFATAVFNGYELAFATDCALFLKATVDHTGTTLPISDKDIALDRGTFRLDVGGLPVGPTDRVAVDLDIADCVIG